MGLSDMVDDHPVYRSGMLRERHQPRRARIKAQWWRPKEPAPTERIASEEITSEEKGPDWWIVGTIAWFAHSALVLASRVPRA
jgi:hypothetical protein